MEQLGNVVTNAIYTIGYKAGASSAKQALKHIAKWP